ncbi:MAG: A24 family peptidase [Treponema sp.]|nr:A24 family peptidase [Treponema sp.]
MYYLIIAACFCIAIAIVDLITYRIPDILLISFAIVMIILIGRQPYNVLILRLVASAVSFLLFGAVWYFTKGIGFGDVKFAAVLGYLLGPGRLAYAFIATALLGFIVYLIGMKIFRWSKTKKIPYAPFLSSGAIVSLFINNNLIGGLM